MEITFKIVAEDMGKSLDNLSEQVEAEIQGAIEAIAFGAHASIIASLQEGAHNPKNRQAYLKGLAYEKIDNNNYLISLDGEWPNKLEEGFSSYDMKKDMLASSKTVGVGARAGEPWVRQNKDGKKFAAVPFEHKPFSKDPGQGDLAKQIKGLVANNLDGKQQKLTQIFRDIDGNPIAGKVAVADKALNPDIDSKLEGLTKFQYVSDKGNTSSVYLTWRMMSEDSDGWIHPGFDGYNLFKQAEEYVEAEFQKLAEKLL